VPSGILLWLQPAALTWPWHGCRQRAGRVSERQHEEAIVHSRAYCSACPDANSSLWDSSSKGKPTYARRIFRCVSIFAVCSISGSILVADVTVPSSSRLNKLCSLTFYQSMGTPIVRLERSNKRPTACSRIRRNFCCKCSQQELALVTIRKCFFCWFMINLLEVFWLFDKKEGLPLVLDIWVG
jgi:hypothetical protein